MENFLEELVKKCVQAKKKGVLNFQEIGMDGFGYGHAYCKLSKESINCKYLCDEKLNNEANGFNYCKKVNYG